MKSSLYFKQKKPIIAPILGVMLLVIGANLFYENKSSTSQIAILILMVLVLFGYSISYEIAVDFKNWRHFKMFGFTLFKSKLKIDYPEYITVFSAIHKQNAEWGPIAAMGKERSGDSWVIRFFSGRKHFTLFRTKSLKKAQLRATELSKLLEVELKK
ncbi:hypothetical protein JQC67_03675 [Aurantibacter crassamenti]|uniref:hypothetical protein n=1 Tax=Aurantibacter crassamenti TaxID=1837375 RepID=UPI00193A2443|nr:hypothetical protein [Aurantibacter crassamenti]MBM1105232.1 hypothetical protein [Aurantibacter crassamenti]